MTKSYDMTEANRRLANLVQVGVVESADYGTGTLRVRIGDIVTADLPMSSARAGGDRTWWPYEIGEQVIVFAPSGNLAAGAILGAMPSDAAPAPGDRAGLHRTIYANGTVIEFDRDANHLRLHLGAGSAEIVATGGLLITGDVTVTGDVVADGISLKAHVHGGVTPGGAKTAGPQ